MNGEIDTPLLVFPEGTTTSGTHLIKFKRGAFDSLLPIKPFLIIKNKNDFDTSTGGGDLLIHFIMFQFFFYHRLEIIELPVICPTEKMYEIFNDKSITDKAEIFSEVTRNIMAEAGNMLISNRGVRDNFIYNKLVHGIPLKSKPIEKKIN
jgi:lysophosphatidylcholine acyltransferase/lyso-PAF acetyltransferase